MAPDIRPREEERIVTAKPLAVAFAASLFVCLASMYVNYRAYQETRYLDWSYKIHGGEITVELSPGWRAVHIYAMRPEERDSHKLEFSPVILAAALLALTLAGRAALAKLSTGDPLKDGLLLVVGYTVIFFGCRAIMDLLDEWG